MEELKHFKIHNDYIKHLTKPVITLRIPDSKKKKVMYYNFMNSSAWFTRDVISTNSTTMKSDDDCVVLGTITSLSHMDSKQKTFLSDSGLLYSKGIGDIFPSDDYHAGDICPSNDNVNTQNDSELIHLLTSADHDMIDELCDITEHYIKISQTASRLIISNANKDKIVKFATVTKTFGKILVTNGNKIRLLSEKLLQKTD